MTSCGGRARGAGDGGRHLFKGSTLVSTLLEHDRERFGTRDAARGCAQRLQDAGHIESVVGSAHFEDSVHLYRWCDGPEVQDVHRLVTTTSSYIPQSRLIELLDLHQPDVCQRMRTQLDAGWNTQATHRDAVSAEDSDRNRLEQLMRMRTRTASPQGELSDSGDRVRARRSSSQSASESMAAGSHFDPAACLFPETKAKAISASLSNDELSSILRDASWRMSEQQAAMAESNLRYRSQSQTFPHVFSPQLNPQRAADPSQRSASTCLPLHDDYSIASDTQTRMDSVHCPLTTQSPLSTRNSLQHDDKEADLSTCTYDGIEMQALDLENIDFDALRSGLELDYNTPREGPTSPRSSTSRGSITRDMDISTTAEQRAISSTSETVVAQFDGVAHQMEVMQQTLAGLEEQSHGYSDNEKQLLEEMKRMRQQHEDVIQNYEGKINDLMRKMSSMKSLAESMDVSSQSSAVPDTRVPANVPEPPPLPTDPPPPAPPAPPAPPPPPPPCPPGSGAPPPPPPLYMTPVSPRVPQPSKAAVKPGVKMRPLFWNRIILHGAQRDSEHETLWQSATEPNFNVEDFETLFGRDLEKTEEEEKKLAQMGVKNKNKRKTQVAKILDENRSRAVAIKMHSLHCGPNEIRTAVYHLDFTRIDLDALHSLSGISGTVEELSKIQTHVVANPDTPLDNPEIFLLAVSKISYFSERIDCLMYKKSFNETVFNIDQQLGTLQNACEEIRSNESLRTVLELVLALGNYMNGGTQRGQADGFHCGILTKLKDVKSMDGCVSLLQYVVRLHCRDHEAESGRSEADYRLPDPTLIHQAAALSFRELDGEMTRLKKQLDSHKRKAEVVCLNTEVELLQPFKDQIEDFFDSAEHLLNHQSKNYSDTVQQYTQILQYLALPADPEKTPSDEFFAQWASFLEEYRATWRQEQRRVAREMFEKVEQKRKERLKTLKRRRSIMGPVDGRGLAAAAAGEGGGGPGAAAGGLKQRFAQMRRRSEHSVHTARLLRSQSVTSVGEMDEMEEDVTVVDGGEGPSLQDVRAWRAERRRQAATSRGWGSQGDEGADCSGKDRAGPSQAVRPGSSLGLEGRGPGTVLGVCVEERPASCLGVVGEAGDGEAAPARDGKRHTEETAAYLPRVRIPRLQAPDRELEPPGGGATLQERMHRRRRSRSGIVGDDLRALIRQQSATGLGGGGGGGVEEAMDESEGCSGGRQGQGDGVLPAHTLPDSAPLPAQHRLAPTARLSLGCDAGHTPSPLGPPPALPAAAPPSAAAAPPQRSLPGRRTVLKSSENLGATETGGVAGGPQVSLLKLRSQAWRRGVENTTTMGQLGGGTRGEERRGSREELFDMETRSQSVTSLR